MKKTLPTIFLIMTIITIFLNFLAFMQLISLFITLPLLFVSLYLTVFSYTRQRVYRGMR